MAAKSGTYVCTLSAEMQEKAKKELNEDPNTRLIEIKTLRERLEKVPGLKCRTDDAFLLRFLRAKKFDQERAYAQVLTFYKMQMEHPDVYENLTPQKVRHILDAGVTGVLKDRAPDGCRVIVYRPGRWDPDKGTIADVLANNFLTMCKLIEHATVEEGQAEKVDVDKQLARQTAEERRLAEMMIPKKHRRLYHKIMYSKKKKTQEAQKLKEKRDAIDKAQKKQKKKAA